MGQQSQREQGLSEGTGEGQRESEVGKSGQEIDFYHQNGCTKIYVGNMHVDITESQVREAFQQNVPLVDIKVVRGNSNGSFQKSCYAFITLGATNRSVLDAIDKVGQVHSSWKINIRGPEAYRHRERSRGEREGKKDWESSGEFPCKVLVRQLFMQGVPERFKQTSIVNIMNHYGTVQRFQLQKGLCYVKYKLIAEATVAFEKAQKTFSLLGSPQGFRVYFSDPEKRAFIVSENNDKQSDLTPHLFLGFPLSFPFDQDSIRRDCQRIGEVTRVCVRRCLARNIMVVSFKRTRMAVIARKQFSKKYEKIQKKIEVVVLVNDQAFLNGRNLETTKQRFQDNKKSKKPTPSPNYDYSFRMPLPFPELKMVPPFENQINPMYPYPISPYSPQVKNWMPPNPSMMGMGMKPIQPNQYPPNPMLNQRMHPMSKMPYMPSAISGSMGGMPGGMVPSGMGPGMNPSLGSSLGSAIGSMGSALGSMGSAMGSCMGPGMGNNMGAGMGSNSGGGMPMGMNPGMGPGIGMGTSMGPSQMSSHVMMGGQYPSSLNYKSGGSRGVSPGYNKMMMPYQDLQWYDKSHHQQANQQEQIWNILSTFSNQSRKEDQKSGREGSIWSGNLTRSRQHSVNVEFFLVEGQKFKLSQSTLNITHRASFQDSTRRKTMSVVVVQPSSPLFRQKFQQYIKYLNTKKRAGVIFTQDFCLHLLPASEYTDKIYQLRGTEMLLLAWPKSDDDLQALQ